MTSEALQGYRQLLERYHGTLDLLSARGLDEIDRLIEEARVYAAVVADAAGADVTVVDLGSGAGLPGIVIATELPAATVHLVERRRRRGAFLEMAVGRLGLSNAAVHTEDVTGLDGICADVVTAQAVSTFASVARLTRHLHRDPCLLVSRRGREWRGELKDLTDWFLEDVAVRGSGNGDLEVGTDSDGHLAPAVVEDRPLGRDGSLVALRVTGGRACPPSA